MYGRVYTAPINVGAHTAQVDYLEILAGSGRPLVLLGFELGQTSEVGDAQEEFLALVLKRMVGATSGSGGSTPTAVPVVPGNTATGATLGTGNTTKAAGGTSAELARFVFPVRAGLLYVPTPEERIVVAAGDRIVLEEVTTPADSITGPVGRVTFAELV